ncbi:cyclopropane fatty acyl phospholipid synthase [Gemmata sp. G18]|uniref:Cyclopropane fatty acyl phospholipid synthase n=1 Tax=Gemmata palustris TaxID=2822762 RepID=A0ABS5BVW0_9BACT|nr:cyclopropane fatty acyl phospholipid synthase [Gemmata palustris]MBP3957865.1 cyclopropane fatty acyl phospholipid synthase [Gemmata palustris]
MRFGSERRVRRLLERADVCVGGNRPWDIEVHDGRFFGSVARSGALGAGEAYSAEWWDCPRLDQLVERVVATGAVDRFAGYLGRARAAWRRAFGNGRGTVADIHYARDPAFFRAWLGPTLNYSCGYWRSATNLDDAQRHKMSLIAAKLQLGPGDRVLDIGCGWGGLARYLGEVGCRVVGVTNTPAQAAFAQRHCAGLDVRILGCDFRDPQVRAAGPFDRVVSVGMFEHVGRRHHGEFLNLCRHVLPPGGLALLHTMGRTTPGDFDSWTDRYIFPNSYVPSMADIVEAAAGRFVVEDWHNFGADYDRTLMAWHAGFEQWAKVQSPPCDPHFYRTWRYYLLTYAGYFRTRQRAQLWQIVLAKDGVAGGYRSVRDVCPTARPEVKKV